MSKQVVMRVIVTVATGTSADETMDKVEAALERAGFPDVYVEQDRSHD